MTQRSSFFSHKNNCQCWPCKHKRGEKTPHRKRCPCCMCKPIFGKKHHMFGKHHTEEAKRANREKHLGRHPTLETINKRIKSLTKPRKIVKCLDCGTLRKIIVNSRKRHGRWKGRCASCARAYNAKKVGHRNKGANHGMWKGGIAHLPYASSWTEQLKDRVRVRDNFHCQICSVPELECQDKLDTHHIDYDKKNCRITNLISLCSNCHTKTNTNREYWKQYFKKGVYA